MARHGSRADIAGIRRAAARFRRCGELAGQASGRLAAATPPTAEFGSSSAARALAADVTRIVNQRVAGVAGLRDRLRQLARNLEAAAEQVEREPLPVLGEESNLR